MKGLMKQMYGSCLCMGWAACTQAICDEPILGVPPCICHVSYKDGLEKFLQSMPTARVEGVWIILNGYPQHHTSQNSILKRAQYYSAVVVQNGQF